ncbi:MAG: hypothetical protein ACW99U_07545 [Candidatus Thorarchaeota archaeon]|jgi:hypothetical protein
MITLEIVVIVMVSSFVLEVCLMRFLTSSVKREFVRHAGQPPAGPSLGERVYSLYLSKGNAVFLLGKSPSALGFSLVMSLVLWDIAVLYGFTLLWAILLVLFIVPAIYSARRRADLRRHLFGKELETSFEIEAPKKHSLTPRQLAVIVSMMSCFYIVFSAVLYISGPFSIDLLDIALYIGGFFVFLFLVWRILRNL